jgi:alkanesulfonate monooxygenase SsuD/methylene tetrahydromethanopterin reductase-like flavin-dependent oxidoreductase (luciferase family)
MRALWSGERDFEGEYWSFHDATSHPHPGLPPRGRSPVEREQPESVRLCGAAAREFRRHGDERHAKLPELSAFQ